MAHLQQFEFIEHVKKTYIDFFKNKTVLEIGSLNINGSVRQFFDNCFYIGIDIATGQDVDIVCLGHEYKAPDNTFDVVISTECFEHDPYWELTFLNMIRMCKQNGLVIFTCATTGRPEHGTVNNDPKASPLTIQKGWNYYKNLTEQDFDKFDLGKKFTEFQFFRNYIHHDLYFYGFKK